MKCWLLTSGKFEQAVQRLLSNVKMGEHQFEVINCGEVAYSIDYQLPANIWINQKKTTPPDLFMIVDSDGGHVFPFASYLERLGVFNYNSVDAKRNAMSKISTYQLLAKEGLPIVKTLVFHKNMTKETLMTEIGLPMVIKPDDGFGGEGVELVKTEAELEIVLEKIQSSDSLMLVQEFVSTSRGRDVRVITIGHEAVFAACRTAGNKDEFRSNLKVGGSAEEYPLTDEIKELCHKVSKAIGLNMSGIDLMFLEEGFVVGEVNSSAGFDSWLGKKDLISLFFNSIKKELIKHPMPHWQLLELQQKARQTQLAELLLGLDDFSFYKSLHALFGQCAQTQEAVLLEMLQAAKNTEFGQKYGFGSINSVEEYRKQVPFSNWEDYEPAMARLEMGESDILFPGQAAFFFRTSGTTSNYKFVPESAREGTARRTISRARMAENFVLFKKEVATKVFVFANKSSTNTTKGGIPCGTASGHTGDTVDPALKEALAYPLQLANLFEGEDLIYMMLRCSLLHPEMTAVLGNNALMFKKIIEYGQSNAEMLVQDIRMGTCRFDLPEGLAQELSGVLAANPERADELEILAAQGQFTPRYYWPKIMVAGFWLGGSVGLYVEDVRASLPQNTRFMDVGYGASEIKMNIPTKPDTPAGALSLFSGFFEFLPQEGGEPLLAHQLEDAKTYEIVITTYGGLYRYRINDLVCVDGFTGDTPNIYFVSKLADVANLAQEKLPGTLLSGAIRKALQDNGHTCLCTQVYPHTEENRYVVCVEVESESVDALEISQILEDALCETLPQYKMYRGRVLAPLVVKLMRRGWSNQLLEQYTKGNATAAQVKIPVVISSLPQPEWWV